MSEPVESYARDFVNPVESDATGTFYHFAFSLRYGEAGQRGLQLKKKLESMGYSVFLCDALCGDNMVKQISHAFANARVRVIFGTPTYGKKTSSPFSTETELGFVLDLYHNEDKRFCVIKMCHRYEEDTTRMTLNSSYSYVQWLEPWSRGSPQGPEEAEAGDCSPPQRVVDELVKVLKSVGSTAATPQDAALAAYTSVSSAQTAAGAPQHTASGGGRGQATVDVELARLLAELDIKEVGDALAGHKITSTFRLRSMLQRCSAESLASRLQLAVYDETMFLELCARVAPPSGAAAGGPPAPSPQAKADAKAEAMKKVQPLLDRAGVKHINDQSPKYESRKPPLGEAAADGNVDDAKLLLIAGADPSARDANGTTPAMWASWKGHLPIVRMLLREHGVPVNETNNIGSSALHFAALGGHLEIVKMLLDNGADVMLKDKYGETPADRAAFNGKKEMETFLRSKMK
mmetsp:Transcript_14356/g.28630  ORF Transcript_14356/g.28630 Transcript_14356/m.28630 type:complete len:462 (-) Transcript_14356:87-1472(-)